MGEGDDTNLRWQLARGVIGAIISEPRALTSGGHSSPRKTVESIPNFRPDHLRCIHAVAK